MAGDTTWSQSTEFAFDRVFGLEEVKKALLECAEQREGMFLYGPSGCGKTMIVYALSNELGANLCRDVGYNVLSFGRGEELKDNVHRFFEEARSFDKAILFLDEIDKVCHNRGSAFYQEEIYPLLLKEMEDLLAYAKESGKVLLPIAATCSPWEVHPTFTSSNVFSKKIYVGFPDAQTRKAMVDKRFGSTSQTNDFLMKADEGTIVAGTEGFSARSVNCLLESIFEKAIMRYCLGGGKAILQEDVDEAFSKFTTLDSKEYLEKLLAWKKENE